MIQLDADGGWSYHTPNGDIVDVEADGSWERVGPSGNVEVNADGSWELVGTSGVVEVKADGSWERTGHGDFQVPAVPVKPAGAGADPVKPVTPRR